MIIFVQFVAVSLTLLRCCVLCECSCFIFSVILNNFSLGLSEYGTQKIPRKIKQLSRPRTNKVRESHSYNAYQMYLLQRALASFFKLQVVLKHLFYREENNSNALLLQQRWTYNCCRMSGKP